MKAVAENIFKNQANIPVYKRLLKSNEALGIVNTDVFIEPTFISDEGFKEFEKLGCMAEKSKLKNAQVIGINRNIPILMKRKPLDAFLLVSSIVKRNWKKEVTAGSDMLLVGNHYYMLLLPPSMGLEVRGWGFAQPNQSKE